jgi:hypothetical protein
VKQFKQPGRSQADELLHPPDEPAGVDDKETSLLAPELLHLPGKPAGVWRGQGYRKAKLQHSRFGPVWSKLVIFCALCVLGADARVHPAEPCQSGLQPGTRPMPYAFVLSTGPNRGVSHCYICETAERPAVIVFARQPNNALGKLAHKLDKALIEHKKADLRGWVTFLNSDQLSLDASIVQWGQKHAISSLPLGTFEDENGPPSYHLARAADVTVLLFVKEKVVANFAFRKGELSDDRITEVMKALPRIVQKK